MEVKILSKYTLTRTKLHHLKKFLWGICPRTPLTSMPLRGTQLAQTPKKVWLPPGKSCIRLWV